MTKLSGIALAGLTLSALTAVSGVHADYYTPYAGMPGPYEFDDSCANSAEKVNVDVRAGLFVDAVRVTCTGTSFYLRPWRGGDGGEKHTLCGAQQELIGINTWSGSVIDAVQGICADQSVGTLLGDRVGGPGGDYSSLRCNRGSRATGIRGESGGEVDGFAVVDRVALRCSSVPGAVGVGRAAGR